MMGWCDFDQFPHMFSMHFLAFSWDRKYILCSKTNFVKQRKEENILAEDVELILEN